MIPANGCYSYDKLDANARLIAAAPDMLEALISVAKKNKLDIESLVLVGKSLESATGQPIKEIIKDAV
jgi:hypothetical protein